MELRDLLQFQDAHIESVSFIPTVDEPKAVLLLAAPMSTEHAKALKVDYAYIGSIPREGLDNVSLGYELANMELHIPTSLEKGVYTALFPELVHKFKLRRIEDARFEISMRIHITGRLADVIDFFQATNKQPFEFAIRPRQGELFEGGTRVELSAKPTPTSDAGLFACPHCDADVPLTDDGTGHVVDEGEVIPCVHPSATAVRAMKSSGSVASKREMAGVQ